MIDIDYTNPRWYDLEDLPNERWKDIEGYEGLYQISNYGRVKSLKRKTNNQFGTERIMQPGNNGHYLHATLCKKGKHKTFCIHILVAKAFVFNPNNNPMVLHTKAVVDGGSNHYSNLYWGTQKENMADRKRDGRFEVSPVCQYTKSGDLVQIHNSVKDIETQTGIKRAHIYECCKGKRKTAGGYTWQYYEEVKDELEI